MAITVLIVDDYEAFAETLEFALNSEGLDTELAFSGTQALEILGRKTFDAVILDVMMPDMDGFEVCRRIRNTPAIADLPVLMLSARTQIADRLSGFQVGVDDYVSKPADPNEIIARVRAMVARARRARPKESPVLAFVGAKGGAGVTTTALNVALALVSQKQRVVYVEFGVNGLSAAWLLGLELRQVLTDVLNTKIPLSLSACESCLYNHASGLVYLPGNAHAIGWTQYPTSRLPELVALLRASYDVVVLDIAASATETCYEALLQASAILPVTECNALSTWHLHALVDWLKHKGLDTQVPGLVIVQHSLVQAREIPFGIAGEVGLGILALVPPTPDLLYHATNRQEPLYLADREDPAALALAELGRSLMSSPIQVPEAFRI